jgi:hypothetical protein
MRSRWGGRIGLLLITAFVGCRPAPAPEFDSAFRRLQRVTIKDGAEFPAGRLHLTAYVIDVGAAPQGTWLDLADPADREQRMVLVYGRAADASLARRFKARILEIDFTAAGRVTLPDGRSALRVIVGGMKARAQPNPAAAR